MISVKSIVKEIRGWKRVGGDGYNISEQDIAIYTAWNDISDEQLADLLSMFKIDYHWEDNTTVSSWRHQVLFGSNI